MFETDKQYFKNEIKNEYNKYNKNSAVSPGAVYRYCTF